MPDFVTIKLNEVGLNVNDFSPKDLMIPKGEIHIIAPVDPKLKKVKWIKDVCVQVKPKSWAHLKQLIGIPDSTAVHLPKLVKQINRIATPETLKEARGTSRFDLTRNALEIAKAYIYSDSTRYVQHLPFLEAVFGKFGIWVPVFRDITINENSILIIHKSVKTLYANSINIKTGGLLKSESDIVSIFCKSIQGNL